MLFWALADKTWPSIVIRKHIRAAVRAPAQRGCPRGGCNLSPGNQEKMSNNCGDRTVLHIAGPPSQVSN